MEGAGLAAGSGPCLGLTDQCTWAGARGEQVEAVN